MDMRDCKLESLWAKKSKSDDDGAYTVNLRDHLLKTADESRKLYRTWLSPALKNQVDEKLLVFLAYSHDLGKASPVFQTQESYRTPQLDSAIMQRLKQSGFKIFDSYSNRKETPHALISHAILKRNGLDDSVCVVVGGHHGKPPTKDSYGNLLAYPKNCGFDDDTWISAQDALLQEALRISELTLESATNIVIPRPMQVILSGLIILADWIASSEENVQLPPMWQPGNIPNIYEKRFNITNPREVQSGLLEAVSDSHNPGVFVVEASMGEGKTEAALAAAEIIASKKGFRGIYFALPSQATSNAMLTRVKKWIEKFDKQDGALSIRLAHGKAGSNDEYEGIKYSANTDGGESAVTVHDWFVGRKKGILADFTIGTIDHVLMAGLKQKHLALRHLGLANKVLIIDECHAYDVYMESYLLTSLKWLGAYGVSVVILSATLPTARRVAVIESYLNKKRLGKDEQWATLQSYPLITYTDGNDVKYLQMPSTSNERNLAVEVEKLDESKIVETLKQALANGGYAGVICNTVKKAQKMYDEIKVTFGSDNVELLHGGFLASDRAAREKDLTVKLGKEAESRTGTRIVVGTQVFEQSLDIDFDVMFTELCPMDLLLQRIGRLHRHKRSTRPVGLGRAKCYVIGADWGNFDEGSAYIYGEYTLMRTCAALPSIINLPSDIPQLVGSVYNENTLLDVPPEYVNDYQNAFNQREAKTQDRKRRAKNFQIKGSLRDRTILGWLDTSYKDSEGEAAVRDGADSIEVLIVQRHKGQLRLLPWINDGEVLPYHTPSERQCKAIVGCSVRLPSVFNYDIGNTIEFIENSMIEADIVDSWYASYWLKGALILILDEEQNAIIGKNRLHYDYHIGLKVEDML